MTTVQQVYEGMQRLAPPELAEHWDNPGLLVDCGGAVRRVLVTLDITPEVVAEAAAKQCTVIVAHHPVIFDPLKRLCPRRCALSAGAGGHFRHLYAHQSGCRRGRGERCAGGSFRHPAAHRLCRRLRPGGGNRTPSQCRNWPRWRSVSWLPCATRRTPARQYR